MGERYEVAAFVPNASGIGYHYETVYYGPSLIGALLAHRSARRAGSGCIKWEVR